MVTIYARRVVGRDLPNLIRHGRNAPLWVQRIWVDPRNLQRVVYGWRDKHSALVIGGDWPYEPEVVTALPKVAAAMAHWQDGVPWEDTGVYGHVMGLIEERGAYDGCSKLDDVVGRYRRIDTMFDQMRADGRLRTRRELSSRAFRERGGVPVHIGADLESVFSGNGQHRLAAALTLGFETMPAYVGVVHPNALSQWKARYLRTPGSG